MKCTNTGGKGSWWKRRKTATELGDAEDELDQQKADNEWGFGRDLDVGDVAFNPMATGVPGMEWPADVFGNELQQRRMQAHHDMVDVQAEVFQVRQDYGQVATERMLQQKQIEIDAEVEINENGWQSGLNPNAVGFNPLATGFNPNAPAGASDSNVQLTSHYTIGMCNACLF